MDTLISIGTLVALLYGVYAFSKTYIIGIPIDFYHFLE